MSANPQPHYSSMTDAELSDQLKEAANPPPPGAQAAFIDWVPLILEVLRRILERSAPPAAQQKP